MDNFIVSARKYRPAAFNTVVGQSAITNTLKNAIRNQQVAQAFLFTGPRGVGKTTCARILAKTINCTNINADGEACDACPSCTSFNKSSSFNIFELDAASNNSVEDIRTLVDQVRIPPQQGYKVYIIDEVHMLSQAAFNAFLKTLEEPPAYAKFILATTEKHKILPTILSRCQIFDFRRIGVDDIANHLLFVAEKENILVEPEALHIIAQKADGGLRDALSMFDQLVSFAGDNLTYKQVIEHLNVLDYEYYFKITNQIIKGNISETLLIINEIFDNGFEGQHFLTGLGEHFRNLLVSKDKVTLPLLEITQSIKDQYFNQASICDIPFLLKSLEIINEFDIHYKTSNNKKLHVEIGLMQLCKLMGSPNLNIIQQLTANSIQPDKLQILPSVEPPKSKHKEEPQNKQQNQAETVETKKPQVKSETSGENPSKNIETVPKEQSKKSITTTGLNLANILGGGSVTGKVRQQDEEETEEEQVSYGQHPVTLSAILTIWPKLIKELAEEQPLLKNTLLDRKPSFENGMVQIMVENAVQRDEVWKDKGRITTFLRKRLMNDLISIEIVLSQGEEIERKPYTDTEKFEYLVKKAPTIREMKDQLGLDLEM